MAVKQYGAVITAMILQWTENIMTVNHPSLRAHHKYNLQRA